MEGKALLNCFKEAFKKASPRLLLYLTLGKQGTTILLHVSAMAAFNCSVLLEDLEELFPRLKLSLVVVRIVFHPVGG